MIAPLQSDKTSNFPKLFLSGVDDDVEQILRFSPPKSVKRINFIFVIIMNLTSTLNTI